MPPPARIAADPEAGHPAGHVPRQLGRRHCRPRAGRPGRVHRRRGALWPPWSTMDAASGDGQAVPDCVTVFAPSSGQSPGRRAPSRPWRRTCSGGRRRRSLPFCTDATRQPWWVQIGAERLEVAGGRLGHHDLRAAMILPPPTGTSVVFTVTGPEAGGAGAVSRCVPQAASAVTAPTAAAPARTRPAGDRGTGWGCRRHSQILAHATDAWLDRMLCVIPVRPPRARHRWYTGSPQARPRELVATMVGMVVMDTSIGRAAPARRRARSGSSSSTTSRR